MFISNSNSYDPEIIFFMLQKKLQQVLCLVDLHTSFHKHIQHPVSYQQWSFFAETVTS